MEFFLSGRRGGGGFSLRLVPLKYGRPVDGLCPHSCESMDQGKRMMMRPVALGANRKLQWACGGGDALRVRSVRRIINLDFFVSLCSFFLSPIAVRSSTFTFISDTFAFHRSSSSSSSHPKHRCRYKSNKADLFEWPEQVVG